MSEELKNKFRRANEEAWNKGNTDAMDEVYAADFVYHRPPFADIEGLEAGKQDVVDTFKAWSDIEFTIHEIVMEGNTTVTRYTWRGKRLGQNPDLPNMIIGKEVILVGCAVSHWANGKVIEEWEFSDYLGYYTQLGVIPPIE
jgi:predicted ester cyclase